MNGAMIIPDLGVESIAKEGAVVVVALVWVLGLGSVVLAAYILCGWRGSKSVAFDWRSMKATFVCR